MAATNHTVDVKDSSALSLQKRYCAGRKLSTTGAVVLGAVKAGEDLSFALDVISNLIHAEGRVTDRSFGLATSELK